MGKTSNLCFYREAFFCIAIVYLIYQLNAHLQLNIYIYIFNCKCAFNWYIKYTIAIKKIFTIKP